MKNQETKSKVQSAGPKDNSNNNPDRNSTARLSDYPEGNLDETKSPDGKTIAEATDPSKLSDL